MRHLAIDGFFADAASMRRVIDRRLADKTPPFDPSRFVWEHWHVDAQFSQLRTPARAFFPAELMASFEARVLRWAGASLGASRLGGPPWLSAILDGGFQGLHRDSPNGQFAFSFALGKNGRFRGGHTLVARDELLDYFRAGSHEDDAASAPLFDEIAPRFNRLVAFDARIPHAVRAVEGPRHPRDARIAIQGWLEIGGVVVVDGRMNGADATSAVNASLESVGRARLRRDLDGAEGVFALRCAIAADGRVRRTDLAASTLARTGDARDQPARAERALRSLLARVRLPPAAGARPGAARIVIPVLVGKDGKARVPA